MFLNGPHIPCSVCYSKNKLGLAVKVITIKEDGHPDQVYAKTDHVKISREILLRERSGGEMQSRPRIDSEHHYISVSFLHLTHTKCVSLLTLWYLLPAGNLMPGRNKQASEWNISFHFPFQQDKYDNQTFFASTEFQSIRNWTPGKLKFHVRKPNKVEVSKWQKGEMCAAWGGLWLIQLGHRLNDMGLSERTNNKV